MRSFLLSFFLLTKSQSLYGLFGLTAVGTWSRTTLTIAVYIWLVIPVILADVPSQLDESRVEGRSPTVQLPVVIIHLACGVVPILVGLTVQIAVLDWAEFQPAFHVDILLWVIRHLATIGLGIVNTEILFNGGDGQMAHVLIAFAAFVPRNKESLLLYLIRLFGRDLVSNHSLELGVVVEEPPSVVGVTDFVIAFLCH